MTEIEDSLSNESADFSSTQVPRKSDYVTDHNGSHHFSPSPFSRIRSKIVAYSGLHYKFFCSDLRAGICSALPCNLAASFLGRVYNETEVSAWSSNGMPEGTLARNHNHSGTSWPRPRDWPYSSTLSLGNLTSPTEMSTMLQTSAMRSSLTSTTQLWLR